MKLFPLITVSITVGAVSFVSLRSETADFKCETKRKQSEKAQRNRAKKNSKTVMKRNGKTNEGR
jgi:hypothetical protein